MPYITEHAPKVSTRSVNSYARESSREKRQKDRQTHRRVVQNHFSRRFEGCTSQIRSYLKLNFLHDANTFIDMEVMDLNFPYKDSPRIPLIFLTFCLLLPCLKSKEVLKFWWKFHSDFSPSSKMFTSIIISYSVKLLYNGFQGTER